MRYYIKRPSECTQEEIKQFLELVKVGSQVNDNGLENRIRNSELLGFCFLDDELVGVSCIKVPSSNYKKRVFKKGLIESKSDEFKYELGYAVTKEKYRGKGINKTLNKKLLASIYDGNIYATTGNSGMIHLLKKLEFNTIGSKYKGKYNDELQILSFTTKKMD